MESRKKIRTLVFTVTLALGILIVLQSIGNQDAILRSPSLLFSHPIESLTTIANEVLNFGNLTSLWSVGISLLALVIIGVTFKMASGGELQELKERLTEVEAARAETESSLQREVRKERHAQRERDSAVNKMEESLNSIYTLQIQLNKEDKLLKNRDTELAVLRAKVSALTQRASQMGSHTEPAERVLRNELTKKTELLQAKEAAIKELEKGLNGKVHALETQLSEKEKLLEGRDRELGAFREQLTKMAASKKQAEDALQQGLRKEQQSSQAKEATIKELEKGLNGKVHALETQLSEKDELLEGRDKELGDFKEQLTKMEASKKQAENLLQQELRKEQQASQAKEAAIKELEKGLNGKVHALETQLSQREKLLEGRDKELGAFRGQLSKIGAAKEQAKSLLQNEFKKKFQLLQAKETFIKELEKLVSTSVHALKTQLSEKEELLKSREEELDRLRSDLNSLKRPLNGSGATLDWWQDLLLQGALTEEKRVRQANEATVRELEKSLNGKVHALESRLSEKEKILKSRDGHIAELASELKEKKILLAKEEIAVLQSIERRASWKHRLAKVGIRIKVDEIKGQT